MGRLLIDAARRILSVAVVVVAVGLLVAPVIAIIALTRRVDNSALRQVLEIGGVLAYVFAVAAFSVRRWPDSFSENGDVSFVWKLPVETVLRLLRYAFVTASVFSPYFLWRWISRWLRWPTSAEVAVVVLGSVCALALGFTLATLVWKVQMAFAGRFHPGDPAARRAAILSVTKDGGSMSTIDVTDDLLRRG